MNKSIDAMSGDKEWLERESGIKWSGNEWGKGGNLAEMIQAAKRKNHTKYTSVVVGLSETYGHLFDISTLDTGVLDKAIWLNGEVDNWKKEETKYADIWTSFNGSKGSDFEDLIDEFIPKMDD